jgi:hypothetical protein
MGADHRVEGEPMTNDNESSSGRWHRHRQAVVVVALAVGAGVYLVGWGDDPVWGWMLVCLAAGIVAFRLVWLPRGHLVVKIVASVAVVAAVLVLMTDPFLAVPRARALAHRDELDAAGSAALASPTTGVFAGTTAPAEPVARLVRSDAEVPVAAVTRLAGESVAYGAVSVEAPRRAMFCLDVGCEVVLVYAPGGEPPLATACADGRAVQVDGLVTDWYRLLSRPC